MLLQYIYFIKITRIAVLTPIRANSGQEKGDVGSRDSQEANPGTSRPGDLYCRKSADRRQLGRTLIVVRCARVRFQAWSECNVTSRTGQSENERGICTMQFAIVLKTMLLSYKTSGTNHDPKLSFHPHCVWINAFKSLKNNNHTM